MTEEISQSIPETLPDCPEEAWKAVRDEILFLKLKVQLLEEARFWEQHKIPVREKLRAWLLATRVVDFLIWNPVLKINARMWPSRNARSRRIQLLLNGKESTEYGFEANRFWSLFGFGVVSGVTYDQHAHRIYRRRRFGRISVSLTPITIT